MFERYLELLEEAGLKNVDVSRATGIPASTFSDWKKGKSSPKQDKLQKIADFFGVQLDYLTGGSDFRTKEEWLQSLDTPENLKRIHNELDEINRRDERDIAKRLESALDDLDNSQDALMFSGEPLDDETRELLKASLENSIRIAKINAKQKFTPKKYRKDND